MKRVDWNKHRPRKRWLPAESRSAQWWKRANSPLIVALVSTLLVGGLLKAHGDQAARLQAEYQDLAARKATLGKLLVEYHKRVSELRAADRTWSDLSSLVAASARVSDVINGAGSYRPTAPEFRDVDFLSLSDQIENVSGVRDQLLSVNRTIGALNTNPGTAASLVRGQIPSLERHVVGMERLYDDGVIPLRRGKRLTTAEAKILGDAELSELMRKENDRLYEKAQRDLTVSGDRR